MAGRNPARSGQVLLLAALTASGAAAADALPVPEEFLEYLGSWESDDADWLVASAVAAAAAAAHPDAPAPTQSQPATAQRGAVPPPVTTERKP